MERWLHKRVSADVDDSHDKKTQEIGVGTLNHLKYERSSYYDIIEPFKDLYADYSDLASIKNIHQDIDEVDSSIKYDRIISVATFEHITDLPKVIAKTCLLLEANSSLITSIPNNGFLWTLG
ncbi:MAG: hypothetical protein OXH57_10015 [Ekhidna sp.]|nr:hypothetical protein [Ekhidna sp.]